MRKYLYAAMFGLFLGSVAGIAGAKHPVPTGRCYREISTETTKDGSTIIISAWRLQLTPRLICL
jgi:hypothetical protein